MLRARDLMEGHVLSVSPETPIIDVHRLFAEEQISAAPVVDQNEEVVGVITTADLVRSLSDESDTAQVETSYLRDVLPFSSPDWGNVPDDLQNRLSQVSAADVMTQGVLSVEPDASAAEVAGLLRKNRVHHVFVIDEEALHGVVSTFDLLQVVEKQR